MVQNRCAVHESVNLHTGFTLCEAFEYSGLYPAEDVKECRDRLGHIRSAKATGVWPALEGPEGVT